MDLHAWNFLYLCSSPSSFSLRSRARSAGPLKKQKDSPWQLPPWKTATLKKGRIWSGEAASTNNAAAAAHYAWSAEVAAAKCTTVELRALRRKRKKRNNKKGFELTVVTPRISDLTYLHRDVRKKI